ncbi:HEPN domain-containing protein, partial [Pseudomonas amygdali]
CIGYPVAIHSVRVSSIEEGDELPRWQDVYFQSLNTGTTAKKKRGRAMLLPHSQIAEQFGAMVQAWLNEYDTLMPALHHYFAVQDEGLAYNDTKFLAIAQALEAFHRRTLPGYRWSKDDFSKKLASIVESVPEAEREWVKQRLCFANELTLGERLGVLLEPYVEIFGGEANVELMVKDTKNTRNYHAHYDKKGEKKALKGAALVALVLRLQVLFTLCLLGRLGVPLEMALNLVKQPNLARLLGNARHLLAEE